MKEYTDTLQVSQPRTVKAGLHVQSKEVLKSTGKKRGKHMEYEKVRKFTGVKLDLAIFKTQKYRITGNDRIHSNGEILISQQPPKNISHEVQHAFTIHSIQGETAKHLLFVDARRMFEMQHWYTALSRGQYIDQIFIIDAPLPDPTEEFQKTKIYKIVSDGTASCYIGHTTKTLDERFEGHQREYKDTKKRKRCSSSEIIKCKNAKIELIEDWPCGSLQEAKAREAHWIATTVGCVNKNLPNQSRKGYKERQAMVTPAPSMQ